MKKITPINKMKELFGEPVDNIGFTKLDVISNPSVGEENNTNKLKCFDYIYDCVHFYPTLLKFYYEKLSYEKNKTNIEVADEIFVPSWNNIHSKMDLKYPVSFGGDHRSEELHMKLNLYSTKQVFAKYTNSNICAALSSKYKFNNKENNSREESFIDVNELNIGKNEFNYITDRKIELHNDKKIINDNIKYLTAYKRSKDLGVFIVCGSQDFLMGEDNIFTCIEEMVSELRKYNENDQYKGITLSTIDISSSETSNPKNSLSIALSRILSGSVLLHDYLLILRNIYNVKYLLEYDISVSSDLQKVNIDKVINKYLSVKKYLTMVLALNQML